MESKDFSVVIKYFSEIKNSDRQISTIDGIFKTVAIGCVDATAALYQSESYLKCYCMGDETKTIEILEINIKPLD